MWKKKFLFTYQKIYVKNLDYISAKVHYVLFQYMNVHIKVYKEFELYLCKNVLYSILICGYICYGTNIYIHINNILSLLMMTIYITIIAQIIDNYCPCLDINNNKYP